MMMMIVRGGGASMDDCSRGVSSRSIYGFIFTVHFFPNSPLYNSDK